MTRTNAKKMTTKGKEMCIRRTSAHPFEGVRDQGRRRNKKRREQTDKWSRGKRRTQRIEEKEIIRSEKENLENCSPLPPAPTSHHFSRALPVLVLIRGQVVGCHFSVLLTHHLPPMRLHQSNLQQKYPLIDPPVFLFSTGPFFLLVHSVLEVVPVKL